MFTLRACIGLGPKFSLMRALGSHCGKDLFEAKELCSANKGQPNVCKNLILDSTLILLNSSSRDCPSLCVGKTLLRYAAWQRAYSHRAVLTAWGHCYWAWSSCFWVLSDRSRIARSAMPFWKWALTPQKVSIWFCELHAAQKKGVSKVAVIAIVVLDLHAVLGGESFEGSFCINGLV
jgi:hypothetical protein